MTTENGFCLNGTILERYEGPGGVVTIPDGVTAIADRAFSNRRDITGLRIPDSVVMLEKSPFVECRNITLFHIPEHLVEGRSLTDLMELFTDHYMNQPGTADRFVAQMLEGKADYSEGFRKRCLGWITYEFLRKRWMQDSIQLDKPVWVVRTLELNQRIPLDELNYYIRLSTGFGRTELTAIFMEYKNTHYTPQEIADATEASLAWEEDPLEGMFE